jgi:hypothetical protein
MIKFILNKQEASDRAKNKKENKKSYYGNRKIIRGNDAKNVAA